MTLPDERVRAIVAAGEFLLALLDPKQTPRVPYAVRQRAGAILRHYPLRTACLYPTPKEFVG